jgi:hypothetical protein
MADAIGAVERLQPYVLLKVTKLACRPPHLESIAIPRDRDASRIIPAILQALEPVQDDWNDVLLAYITNDATHKCLIHPSSKHEGGAIPLP